MRIRPTVQMSLGLALLTGAVLLVVDLLFGVFTDPDVQLMRQRKALAESIATQVAVLLERGDQQARWGSRWRASAIRIRTSVHWACAGPNGTLVAQAGNHRQTWGELEGGPFDAHPVVRSAQRWQPALGQLRGRLLSGRAQRIGARLGHPSGSRCLCIALLGTLVYWQYIHRALVHLDPKAVIPERVRLAFDVMTEGVVVLDSRGRVLLANRAFRALPGDESAGSGGPPALGAALAGGGALGGCQRASLDARDA